VAIPGLTLRTLARRIADLDEELTVLNARGRRVTPSPKSSRRTAPARTPRADCCSPPATTQRLGSERSGAALLASNPIQASSGKTTRHRLNRGGDRHGNSALWRIVVVRIASDPRTQAKVERRTKEGLRTTEIIRCLKR
jgi:transposase